MLFDEYCKLFDNPATDKWQIINDESSSSRIVVTPNRHKLVLTSEIQEPDFWKKNYRTDNATTKLWVRSLWYLVPLFEQGETDLVETIINSYSVFLETSGNDARRVGMNSLDHCLGINLRTLARLLRNPRISENSTLHGLILKLMHQVLQVISTGDFFHPNNHAVMLTLGITHALSALPADFDTCGLTKDFCVKFLVETFHTVAGPNNIVGENTPVYHLLWIDWAKEVALTLQSLFNDSKSAAVFWKYSANFKNTLSYYGVTDSCAIPFGDGNSRTGGSIGVSKGKIVSQDDGQYLFNSGGGTVFHYVCGSRLATHKHADDQSIRLWISGEEFLADAGIFSYDLSNPYCRIATSQRGHSGLFALEFDHIPGPHFYPWNDKNKNVRTTFSVAESPRGDVISSLKVIHEKHRFSRQIRFDSDDQFFRVRDFVTSESRITPVSRFLIPRSLEVKSISMNRIQLTGKNARMILFFPDKEVAGYLQLAEDLGRLDSDEDVRPFICNGIEKIDPCHELVVPLDSVGKNRWSLQADFKYFF